MKILNACIKKKKYNLVLKYLDILVHPIRIEYAGDPEDCPAGFLSPICDQRVDVFSKKKRVKKNINPSY